MAVGDDRPGGGQVGRDRGESAGSVIAQIRCRRPSAVTVSARGPPVESGLFDEAPGPRPARPARPGRRAGRSARGSPAVASISWRRPATGPGATPSCGRTIPASRGLEPQRPDQAALDHRRGARPPLVTVLFVDVEGRLRIRAQDLARSARRPAVRAASLYSLPGRPWICRGRISRTTLCGSAAISWSSMSWAMTSYGGEVTSASPLTLSWA